MRIIAALLLLLAALAVPQASMAGEYVDAAGRRVVIPAEPRRIVSLAPNITETLFALGLDERIAGVSRFSAYPEAALKKPTVGSYVNISLERVMALKPDLVVATVDGNRRDVVERLEDAGIAVYATNPSNMEGLLDMIEVLGIISGRQAEARNLVRSLRERIEAVRSRLASLERPRVFLQIGEAPIVSVGPGAFQDELIALAGGVSVTHGAPVKYPRCGIEDVIATKPDVIIVTSMQRGSNFESVKNSWKRWKDVPAVKGGRIHVIDSDIIDRPSPRLVDGLEELSKIIHPPVPERVAAGR